ncbi:MAG: c-type cytochrome, partial [Pseudolabrys sp.]|nr:c-type cytochrome [Pseudolabrys sp.]
MIRMGLLALALGVALAGFTGAAQAQSPQVERGAYLVNTVMTCQNCHTPMGPNGPDFSKALSGGITFDEPPFKVTGSNITQDKETGIGAWTDAQIKTLLRTGKRPNGVPVAEIMPTAFYGIVTESDMDAIVAYLRTVKPVRNKVPDPVYKIPLPHHAFPGSEKPYTEAMLT